MDDKAQRLNQALPKLIKAINKVLTGHELTDLIVSRFDFSDNIPVAASPEGIEESNIPICPPEDQIHGCITCRNPVTGQVMYICRP